MHIQSYDVVQAAASEGTDLLREPPLTDEDVHQLRKHGKRLRALLRQARPALGKRHTRPVETAFRDAAQALSALRDARVLQDTLAEVGLAEPAPAHGVEVREQARLEALALWTAATAAAQDLSWSRVDASALVCGIGESYARSHLRWRQLRNDHDPSPTALHELRKAIKAVGYQLDVLVPAWPPVLAAVAGQVDLLQQALGAHHDGHVLQQLLIARDVAPPPELYERQVGLLDTIWGLAPPLLAPRPKVWTRWLGAVALSDAGEPAPR
jgi:CHAD domain-containing protein